LSGFACRVQDVRYVHPLKLKFHQIILDNESEQINIPIDSLLIGFEMKWPIEHVDFSAVLYGGVVESGVLLDLKSNRIDLEGFAVASVRLDDINFLQKRIDRQIRGILYISGRITGIGMDLSETEFAGTMKIDNLYTRLRRPILGTSEIEFKQIEVDTVLKRNRIDLLGGRLTGPLLNGKFSGGVILQKPWQESGLDVVVGLIPHPQLLQSDPQVEEAAAQLYRKYRMKAIPGLVGGSIKYPQFSFGRKNDAKVIRVQ